MSRNPMSRNPITTIPRALVLRRLSRAGAHIRRSGSGTQRVQVWSAAGEPVEVPPGRLTARQIGELLIALGIAVHEFEDMR